MVKENVDFVFFPRRILASLGWGFWGGKDEEMKE